jgi:hypothetical protein
VLKDWETFYFMLGSAGAGLIGLLFVVITLTAGFDRQQTFRGGRLYLSPTVVDFALILTMSAFVIAPALPIQATAALIAATAIVGLVFAVRSSIGISGSPPAGIEAPHWTDLWMYGVVPGVIHAGILLSAAALWAEAPLAAYGLAALLLGLLLVSIRNAWDLITWITPRSRDAAP